MLLVECAISLPNFKIAQFQNATQFGNLQITLRNLRNLQNAQIGKMRGTYILDLTVYSLRSHKSSYQRQLSTKMVAKIMPIIYINTILVESP